MSDSFSISPQPQRLGSLRAGSIDTRGDDLTAMLSPVNDPLSSVTSVAVVRLDGRPCGAGDLQATPVGYAAPWLTVYPGGAVSATGYVVNWWTTAGALIASGGPVDYIVTITAVTTGGRDIVHDLYLQVTALQG